MKYWLILSLLWSGSAWSLTWDQLEIGRSFVLTSPIRLSSDLILTDRAPMKLVEIDSLGQIQVYLFEFRLLNCPASLANRKSEIVIVKNKYGVELQQGCKVYQYVEFVDFNRESLLKGL